MIRYSSIAIKGISACAPKSTMEIASCEILSESEKKTICKHYGINRVHKSKLITTYDLCHAAAENLLKNINWIPDEVDFLISVTQTPDYLMPSNSGYYQQSLSLRKDSIAYEINTGCSGFVQAILIASGMLQNPNIKKGLILCGETTYNVSETDKSTFPYMGDAGTATAIEFDPSADDIFFNTWQDGAYSDAIQIMKGGAKSYTKDENNILKTEDLKVVMNGEKVKDFIFYQTIPNISKLIEEAKIALNTIDYFIFHQVNKLIFNSIARKLDIPLDKLLTSF